MTGVRRGLAGLVVVGALVLPTGCGADGSSARVNEELTQVDAAIAAGRLGQARARLDDLVRETDLARASGTISQGHAEAIEAAAARLAVRLPMPGRRVR
jgi:hypothetical protein